MYHLFVLTGITQKYLIAYIVKEYLDLEIIYFWQLDEEICFFFSKIKLGHSIQTSIE